MTTCLNPLSIYPLLCEMQQFPQDSIFLIFENHWVDIRYILGHFQYYCTWLFSINFHFCNHINNHVHRTLYLLFIVRIVHIVHIWPFSKVLIFHFMLTWKWGAKLLGGSFIIFWLCVSCFLTLYYLCFWSHELNSDY